MQSKSLFLAIALAVLLILPTTVTGQIWIDGVERYEVAGNRIQSPSDTAFVGFSANSVAVYGFRAYDPVKDVIHFWPALFSHVGSIGSATVGGNIYHESWGSSYEVWGNIYNYGHINTVTVENYGNLINHNPLANPDLYPYYAINTVEVRGGYVQNSGRIDRLSVNSGSVDSINGDINSLFVNGGFVTNRGNAIINTASVTGGTLNNGDNNNLPGYRTTIIHTLKLSGGTVNNKAWIDNLIYTGGIFNGQISGSGRISTLTLAGDAANNTGNWGVIKNLAFDNNGNGIITLTTSANPAMAMSAAFDGLIPAGNAALPDISFSTGINAQNIDFTYGNISFDLTGLAGFAEADVLSSLFAGDGFMVAALFGTANMTGMDDLNSLQLAKGDEWFYIFNDGVVADGWDFNLTNGLVRWDGMTAIEWVSGVPEPATLLILGLGLAGLPIMRRLRRG